VDSIGRRPRGDRHSPRQGFGQRHYFLSLVQQWQPGQSGRSVGGGAWVACLALDKNQR
jgi:hypothetical protein